MPKVKIKCKGPGFPDKSGFPLRSNRQGSGFISRKGAKPPNMSSLRDKSVVQPSLIET